MMIILASQSPRRRELMKLITPDFTVKVSDVDETLPKGIAPDKAVLYLSKIKAEPFAGKGVTVIGADTVVAIDGEILGKPANTDEAEEMLKKLSGKTHSVFTGVTVIKDGETHSFCEKTDVKFFDLSEKEINNYVKTGEPLDKAGAYGIQGFGALLVEGINGDYFNVVGLPISRLNRLLMEI